MTLTYNHTIEMNLLILQARSMKYVDEALINKIFILYNDVGDYDFTEIIANYPVALQGRVRILRVPEISDVVLPSNWFSQQIYKILVARCVEADHYLVLDGKNHFIRPVNYKDYFNSERKPRLFKGYPGSMVKYYHRCLQYFGAVDPYADKSEQLVTTTPYLLKKADVLDMVRHIEEKERTSFIQFFERYKFTSISEFYLYSTYLILTKKIDNYRLTMYNFRSIMSNPTASYNIYEKIGVGTLNNPKIKIFGLHRAAVLTMDDTYKQNLLAFYPTFFDADTCEFIRNRILYCKI